MFLQLSQTIAVGASTFGQFPRGKNFEACFLATVEVQLVIYVRERIGQHSSM